MVGLKRLSLAVAFAAVSGAVVVGVGATPAFASTLLTCTGGSGTATLSPGISNTPSTQTISGTNSFTGCSPGAITGGSMTSSIHTSTPGTCSSLVTPPPAGTVEATGTGTITWSNGTTSTGSVKAKSKGPSLPTEQGLIFKITSGQFFAAGHTTKLKVTIAFSLPSGSTCPTITTINSSDTGNAVVSQI